MIQNDQEKEWMLPLLELRNERSVKMSRVGKKRAGRILDGTTWDGLPDTRLIHA